MSSTTVKVDNSLGALYLGVTLAMSLWGIATIQTYYYYDRYVKDALWLKLFVFLVWALDTVHQALILHAGYVYLITNYANPTFIANIVITLEVMVVISGLVCLIVQSFLLFRVWMLSGKKIWLVSFLASFVILEFVLTTFFFYKGVRMESFIDLLSLDWLLKLTNSINAVTDILITATLIALLHRSRTGFRRSDNMINRLILFTVNTGALTSILAIIIVIMIQLYPTTLIYVAFYCCISRFYTNTLLATLNARRVTDTGTDIQASVSDNIPNFQHDTRGTKRSLNRMAIRVETETSHRADNISLDELTTSKVTSDTIDLEHNQYDSKNQLSKRGF
ncbi:hypothetical protein PNOK_0878100 [Pyrrhoderma noxium]|uniref:DUF6534 domain-containing protein n=1 Tax=Pyrrhoderma noxium TaxID=2282107 RepID=A0A286U8J9_9AGAM|nr:hypothetical protein PNOK_0878100 [Pyrrhoderma noxium]